MAEAVTLATEKVAISLIAFLLYQLLELVKQIVKPDRPDEDPISKEIDSRIKQAFRLPDNADAEHGPPVIDPHAAGDALFLAAHYNYSAEILVDLLRRPECSNLLHRPNAKSESLLHIAAKAGHLDLIKELLARDDIVAGEGRQAQRLVEMRSTAGNTALHEAVRSKNLEAVETIADAGKEMIAVANDEVRSPLYCAVEMGFVQGVRSMLDKDPDACRQTGPGGRSLLHAAVGSANLDVAEVLLDRAKLLQPALLLARKMDDKGQNSMHYATTCGSLQAVKLLLGRDRWTASAVDRRGRLPIHLAAIHGREDMVREIFLKCPDSAYLFDDMGRNILHLAVENGRQGVVAFILRVSKLRFLLNERDYNGDSPMHLAVKKLNIPLLHLICSRHGIDKGIINNQGQTAIDIAESITDPYMKQQKIRMLQALKYVGVPRGKHGEDQEQDVISSSTHDRPVINSSDNGRAAGHDPNRRGRRGTENEPEEDVISNLTHDHPVINSSDNGEGGHDQIRRGGRGTENDPEETTSMRSLKSRANTLSLLAILIATVTFAAAFTMPGGYEQDGPNKGAPVWATRPAFKVFLIANTLAMTMSVAVAILQIWASASDQRVIVYTVKFCQNLTFIAILSMIVAFVAGVYVVMAGRSKWLAIFVCALGPGLFMFLLSPLNFCQLWPLDCINLELTELSGLDYASVLSFDDLDRDDNAVAKSCAVTLAAWVLTVEQMPFHIATWVTGLGSRFFCFSR